MITIVYHHVLCKTCYWLIKNSALLQLLLLHYVSRIDYVFVLFIDKTYQASFIIWLLQQT